MEASQAATSITFTVSLQAGRNTLRGWLRDRFGKNLAKAHYGGVRPSR